MKKEKKSLSGKKVAIMVIIILIVSIYLLSLIVHKNKISIGEKVALIPIFGAIATESSNDILGNNAVSSTEIINLIDKAEEDRSIKAVLFEINSPGGTPVGSKEISDRIKRMKKPKIALIREVGASGAYWISSSCDEIIANDLSIVGSIGVIGSYLEFSGLLEKYNITYQRLVAGKYKDSGSPFKSMEENEKEKIQSLIDTLHTEFIKEVAKNRNMDIEKVKELATGEIFLGLECIDNGLVDYLGDKEIAKDRLKKILNTEDIGFIEYKRKTSFLESLSGLFNSQSFYIGKGIGQEILNLKTQNKIDILT